MFSDYQAVNPTTMIIAVAVTALLVTQAHADDSDKSLSAKGNNPAANPGKKKSFTEYLIYFVFTVRSV